MSPVIMFKKAIITFVVGTLIFLLGTFIFGDYSFKSPNELLEVFLFHQLYSFVLGYSNMVFFDLWYSNLWLKQQPILKVVIGFLSSVVITMLGLFLLRFFTRVLYNGQTLAYFFDTENLTNYKFGLWITLIIVSIFHIGYYINRYQKQQLKQQKVIAKTANAQFDALKSQLDPHFLFNSLNVLSSLIHENPDKAEQFTTKLSKVYRYVLEQKNKELVPLEEELAFAKTYIDLLTMRFEDSLFFEFPTTLKNNESKVVPLSLQLLLENAVKHNIVNTENPLHIKIYEDGNYLNIENNLQPKKILKSSSGFGLNNIKQRYQLLTNQAVSISKNETLFQVKLPLINKNFSQMESQLIYNQSTAYQRASKRVEVLKGFYSNLISYCIVIPILIIINYLTSWHIKWFGAPLIFWGISILFHAFNVFGPGVKWEEKKIEAFIKKDKLKRN